ncbi:MAG: type II toxin-antitoxin system RelE/ParE family toxin, partial [Gammaproteobacteria bacterium]
MILTLSARAETDLEEIADFIARDDPAKALSFVQELRAHCQSLVDIPEAYPIRPELGPGIRVAVHKSYLIIYRLVDEGVLVVRMLHGARQLVRLM